jgi:hypothetical protein
VFDSFGEWLEEAPWRHYRNHYVPVPGWGLYSLAQFGFVFDSFCLVPPRSGGRNQNDTTTKPNLAGKSSPPDPDELWIFTRRVDLLVLGWQAEVGDHLAQGTQVEALNYLAELRSRLDIGGL